MNEEFKVGEIAIYIRGGSINYGLEVEITGPLEFARVKMVGSSEIVMGWVYTIEGNFSGPQKPPDSSWVALPHELRKKRPPKEAVGRWENCVWQPKEVAITR